MKGSTYEGGLRAPCVVRWPGKIPAGLVSEGLSVNMDLFATALDVAGIKPPSDRVIDGKSLLPMLTRHAASQHEFIVGNQHVVRVRGTPRVVPRAVRIPPPLRPLINSGKINEGNLVCHFCAHENTTLAAWV